MIFGLALSVGALALVASPPKDSGTLYQDITTFGFSFLILISVWFAYTRIMSVLPLEDRVTVTLNTTLLFTVSVEPFLFNVLQTTGSGSAFATSVGQAYAVDLGVMMVVLAIFAWTLATEPGRPLSAEIRQSFREEAALRVVSAGFFFGSLAPVFDQVVLHGQTARTLLWIVPLVLLIAGRRKRDKTEGV
jgi:uncharacterized membrane protein